MGINDQTLTARLLIHVALVFFILRLEKLNLSLEQEKEYYEIIINGANTRYINIIFCIL